MSSSIKFSLLFFLLPLISGWAQDVNVDEGDSIVDPETVFFNLGVFQPVGLGNSALAEEYDLNPGFSFDFNWFVLPEITIGTNFSVFRGDVTQFQKVGNISSTTIYLFGVQAGYYYEFDDFWNIHATAGIGSVQHSNRTPEDRFNEQGTTYWFQVQVAYRFNKTVAVYFNINPRMDRLRIETPAHLDTFFNKHLYINPGFGLRLNLQNPGG